MMMLSDRKGVKMRYKELKKKLVINNINNVTNISKLLGISRQQYYKSIDSDEELSGYQLSRVEYFFNKLEEKNSDDKDDNILKNSVIELDHANLIDKIVNNKLTIEQKNDFYILIKSVFNSKMAEKNFDIFTGFLSLIAFENIDTYFYMAFLDKYITGESVGKYIPNYEKEQKKMEYLLYMAFLEYKREATVVSEEQYMKFEIYCNDKNKIVNDAVHKLNDELKKLVIDDKKEENSKDLEEKIKNVISDFLVNFK